MNNKKIAKIMRKKPNVPRIAAGTIHSGKVTIHQDQATVPVNFKIRKIMNSINVNGIPPVM